ncbi:hypothetical protein AKJ09_02011 [Labilithrix luteola]|uniref:Type IV fimbrial biogenesis protein PilY1 n=1 Tax=Labilithrix luteola TaxID=1391654 RepID=A0A0K1PPA8_9BACT|nr:hypothetical protein [Labilithrix luteola]AKU95347.1 hypothetical protein AKJ09_02011 [Labilithrix luteola]
MKLVNGRSRLFGALAAVRGPALLASLVGPCAAGALASCAADTGFVDVDATDAGRLEPVDAEPVVRDALAEDAECSSDSACPPTKGPCDGVAFCPVPLPLDSTRALRTVWGTQKDDVWAVGTAGTVMHWDGTSWASVPAKTTRTLTTVTGSSKNDVWVGGSTAAVFHTDGFANGTATWVATPIAPPYDQGGLESLLTSSWLRSSGELWLGGRCYPGSDTYGSRWRSSSIDGVTTWTPEDPSWYCEMGDTYALWGANATDLWMTSFRGRVYRGVVPDSPPAVDGSSDPVWTEYDSQTLGPLYATWGSSTDDVWFVGESGAIRHHNGSTILERVESSTPHDLYGIWGRAPTTSGPSEKRARSSTTTARNGDASA